MGYGLSGSCVLKPLSLRKNYLADIGQLQLLGLFLSDLFSAPTTRRKKTLTSFFHEELHYGHRHNGCKGVPRGSVAQLIERP